MAAVMGGLSFQSGHERVAAAALEFFAFASRKGDKKCANLNRRQRRPTHSMPSRVLANPSSGCDNLFSPFAEGVILIKVNKDG